jgi:hypothetical protein
MWQGKDHPGVPFGGARVSCTGHCNRLATRNHILCGILPEAGALQCCACCHTQKRSTRAPHTPAAHTSTTNGLLSTQPLEHTWQTAAGATAHQRGQPHHRHPAIELAQHSAAAHSRYGCIQNTPHCLTEQDHWRTTCLTPSCSPVSALIPCHALGSLGGQRDILLSERESKQAGSSTCVGLHPLPCAIAVCCICDLDLRFTMGCPREVEPPQTQPRPTTTPQSKQLQGGSSTHPRHTPAHTHCRSSSSSSCPIMQAGGGWGPCS